MIDFTALRRNLKGQPNSEINRWVIEEGEALSVLQIATLMDISQFD